MSQATIIAALIAEAAPRIAVVFIGATPRLIGTVEAAPTAAAVRPAVDAMLVARNLSATRISRAACFDRVFVAAHA